MDKETKTILIVEDEQELALGLSTLFRSKGYNTLVAYDAIYAVSIALNQKINLVILDLGLPAGGGFLVLEHLKGSIKTNNIPVLILTARKDPESEDKAFKLGVAAYIHKPFEPEKLLDQVSNLLNQ